jgi:hypothetical protein
MLLFTQFTVFFRFAEIGFKGHVAILLLEVVGGYFIFLFDFFIYVAFLLDLLF